MNPQELKRILHYDPESGVFVWKVKPSMIVDSGDIAGTICTDGYINILIKRKRYKAHRLAFLYMTGEFPEYVDHINGIRDDNRWNNLRECSRKQNAQNAKLRTDNSSGIKGVYWHSRAKKWAAQARMDGKTKTIGYFIDKNEAILARTEFVNKNYDKRFYREH